MSEKIGRKEQAINTKNKLIKTALNLFREHGFENVTINQICKNANVTTGAFYHHLKSKAGIITEGYIAYDDYFDKLIDNINTSKPYIQQFNDCLWYQVEYIQSLGVNGIAEVYKIQISEYNEFFLSKNRSLYKFINKLVIKAQENNEITKEFSSDDITSELLIIIRGVVYNWCQNKGEYDLLALQQKVTMNYIKAYLVN